MSDLNIGQKIEGAPPCATPRVEGLAPHRRLDVDAAPIPAPAADALAEAQIREANIEAAERLLDKADRQVIEARRGIGVLRTGKGGVIYPTTCARQAVGLIEDAIQKLTEAMGIQAAAGEGGAP